MELQQGLGIGAQDRLHICVAEGVAVLRSQGRQPLKYLFTLLQRYLSSGAGEIARPQYPFYPDTVTHPVKDIECLCGRIPQFSRPQ